jgi:ABC-2 type transport system permease protein
MIWTVAKKELRGYFNSAVAVIFLAAFLLATLILFFSVEKFFARGLADLRLLFKWMPLVLIILASALAMRLWADERRAGTIEVLLTLPVPRWKLVTGKFVAGMLLIAIALGLTLGLPITISMMGNLDTGPVIGGYLGALLLAAAYLSIGMCVSAVTDNQIVAFIGTALICGAAYLYKLFDEGSIGAILRLFSTDTHFESVARGVLDLRDLAYYASITVTGLALNVLLLGRLSWGRGPRARNRRTGAILAVVLIAANAIVLNLWLAPVGRAQIDMTQDRTYSLSSPTKSILRSLDERLLIRAYLTDSEQLIDKLKPLGPQIRDLLEGYRVAGGGRVRVEILDPTDSKDAKREAKERFSIEAVPIPFANEKGKSLVNTYLAIAIEYGDQHEVLGIDDLLQVRSRDIGDVEVSLRNPEYQITKSIKKVVTAFSSLDSLFASAPGQVKLVAYLTPKTMPKDIAAVPDKLKKVAEELGKQSKGKLAYSVVEPRYATQRTPDAEQEAREILRRHGVQPRAELLSDKVFYYGVVMEVGDKVVPVPLAMEDVGEAAIKSAITDALKRGSPGFRKVVGVWTPPPMGQQPQFEGMPPQQMPPPQAFQLLSRELGESYELRNVKLDARVPDSVDVLVLAGPADLDAKAAENVDQFVMRGGALVVLGGRFRPALMGDGTQLEKVTTGLEGLFQKWGITIDDELVVDAKNEAFVRPVQKDLGNGIITQELEQHPHGLLVRITGDQLSSGSVITSGLPGAVIAFGSPVSAEEKVEGDQRQVEVLLRSSPASWLTKSTAALADSEHYPDVGFPGPEAADKRGSRTLAVAIAGTFASGVAKPADKGGDKAGSGAPQLVEHSPPNTRIVVFGSSSFVSDDIVGLARQLNSDLVVSNIQLVQNAIDWAVSDTDLLAIRARTTAARAITVEPDARDTWRTANYIIAFLALAGIVGLAWFRRRTVRPVVAPKEV